MDSFQFWLYVIIAVIYVISKAMKKSNRQKQEQAQTPPRSTGPAAGETAESPPPLSFEELLREITEGKKRKSEPAPQPPPRQVSTVPRFERPKPTYVNYDDDPEEEEKSLERVDYDLQRQETTRQVYERAQREAALKSSLQTLQSDIKGMQSEIKGRKSSLETLQSSLGSPSRFESFRVTSKENLLTEYLRELRTPSGMKKAVVLSEILKTKF